MITVWVRIAYACARAPRRVRAISLWFTIDVTSDNLSQNKGIGCGVDAESFNVVVGRFTERVFADVSAQQEMIAMLLETLTVPLGSPPTL